MVPFLQLSPQKSCTHLFSPPYLWYAATSHPPLFDHANNTSIWWLQRSQSQWLHSLWHGSVTTHLLGVQVQIPPEVWMFVSYKRCVLSGRGLCDGLIPCPEEYYQVCVCVCQWVWPGATITLFTYNKQVEEVRLRKKEICIIHEDLHYAIFPTLLLLPPTQF